MTELRYPLKMLDKSTDYLQINISQYKASGLNRGSNVDKFFGDLNLGGIPNKITVNGRSVDDTPENRIRAAREQNLPAAGGIYNVGRRNRRFSKLKKNDSTIILPIPSNIQDGNSVTFGAGEMDGLTAATLGVIQDSFDTAGQGKPIDAVKQLFVGAGSIALSDDVKDYFLRQLASGAANIPFGGNLTAAQILSRQTGQILNPNMELLFSGVNLRSFKFSFKMTPRNETEAERIRDIIRKFKESMSPSIGGGTDFGNERLSDLYLNPPNIFKLEYKKGPDPHPFLHKFKECALTDMSVNYTGEGTYATYGGDLSAPVSMVMDLGFKELEPVYSSDYNTTEGKGGVGY